MHLPLRSSVTLASLLLSIGGCLCAAASAEKRYVIIHADDAGMSHSVNAATIEAMEQGIVSSASIMVPCPWFKEIAAYAKAHPDKDFGIHLTLNCEWKDYRWGPVAPRTGAEPDRLRGLPVGRRAGCRVGCQSHGSGDRAAGPDQAGLEFGVPVTHLDTHMGAVVSRPDLIEVYVKLGIEFNVPVFFIRGLNVGIMATNPQVHARGVELLKLLDDHHLPVLDFMTQYYTGEPYDTKKKMYLKAIEETKPGVRYLIIHCGYNNEELQAITPSAELRDNDRRVFTDPEVMEAVKKSGVEVVSWKQLREMNAKQPVAD